MTKEIAKVEMISPARAHDLLERMMKPQRRLAVTTVDMYARAMSAGAWRLTAQGIEVSEAGITLNGQHRLHAVIKSGCTIPMLVMYGVKHEALDAIDQIRPRSASDILGISGEKRTRLLSAIGMMLFRLENKREYPIKLSFHEVRDAVARHSARVSWTIANYPDKIEPGIFGGGAAVRAGFAFAMSHFERVPEFIERVKLGNCAKNDPAYVLRGAIHSARATADRYILACKTVRACAAFAANEQLGVLRDDATLVLNKLPPQRVAFEAGEAQP